jgi:tRNA threonylcarbamoyladenosine modification (KEOPS) complex  Pcc1 subunit
MSSSHEPFDDSTKAFYKQFFKNKGIAVESEREVFSRGRRIDLVITCTDSDKAQLKNTVFSHFRWLNVLELKGIHDPLTLLDYNRIMMRAWALGASKIEDEAENDNDDEDEEIDSFEKETHRNVNNDKLNRYPSLRTLTIVCVVKPLKLLNKMKQEIRFVKVDDGIYNCEEGFSQWIICPSELALIESNYPLLPLARGEKLSQFLSLCLREGLTNYLQLIVDIGLATDPTVIWEKILEVKKMKPKLHEDTIPYIDRYFRELPEQMWKIGVIREALAESAWHGRQEGKDEGKLHTQHRILIRQLQRKFSSIPENVIKKIESTEDIEQLDNWLDQVIVADSLKNTGLLSFDNE